MRVGEENEELAPGCYGVRLYPSRAQRAWGGPREGSRASAGVGSVTDERTDEQKVMEKNKGHAHQLELRTFSPQFGEREGVGGRENLQCGVGETEALFLKILFIIIFFFF